jgi:hypothetical protein
MAAKANLVKLEKTDFCTRTHAPNSPSIHRLLGGILAGTGEVDESLEQGNRCRGHRTLTCGREAARTSAEPYD